MTQFQLKRHEEKSVRAARERFLSSGRATGREDTSLLPLASVTSDRDAWSCCSFAIEQKKKKEQREGRNLALLESLITNPEVFSATGIKPVSFTQQTKAAGPTIGDFICLSIYYYLT